MLSEYGFTGSFILCGNAESVRKLGVLVTNFEQLQLQYLDDVAVIFNRL
jgi:hypothetical protein